MQPSLTWDSANLLPQPSRHCVKDVSYHDSDINSAKGYHHKDPHLAERKPEAARLSDWPKALWVVRDGQRPPKTVLPSSVSPVDRRGWGHGGTGGTNKARSQTRSWGVEAKKTPFRVERGWSHMASWPSGPATPAQSSHVVRVPEPRAGAQQ